MPLALLITRSSGCRPRPEKTHTHTHEILLSSVWRSGVGWGGGKSNQDEAKVEGGGGGRHEWKRREKSFSPVFHILVRCREKTLKLVPDGNLLLLLLAALLQNPNDRTEVACVCEAAISDANEKRFKNRHGMEERRRERKGESEMLDYRRRMQVLGCFIRV